MKYIHLITMAFLVFSGKANEMAPLSTPPVGLTIIEQDYDKALKMAAEQNKLLFVDFYTTWCIPCKRLDKLVFQDETMQESLGKNVVLLKYDAENDSVFHLSKKHHVSSYPTGLILNKEGYVLNRKYGFRGDNAEELQKNVLEFTEEALVLNKENKVLKGYSNTIDPSKYPTFYVDFVNRTNTKIDMKQVADYFNSAKDVLAEEYFSTLIYFAREAPVSVADNVLENKQRYIDRYGEGDVETLLYFLTSAKFNAAISANSQEEYDAAVAFTKKALSEEWVNDILPMYEKDFLKAQNKWGEVFKITEAEKNNDKLSEGAINYFCWDVYKNCDDQQVILGCIDWMKEVTDHTPSYAYLDTYAFLLYKSGNKEKTKAVAERALKAAKEENESPKAMEALLEKL